MFDLLGIISIRAFSQDRNDLAREARIDPTLNTLRLFFDIVLGAVLRLRHCRGRRTVAHPHYETVHGDRQRGWSGVWKGGSDTRIAFSV